MVTETEMFESTNKNKLQMLMKKVKLLTVILIILMLEWQKLLQIAKNIPKFHIRTQCILQLVSKDLVYFAWVDLHVS